MLAVFLVLSIPALVPIWLLVKPQYDSTAVIRVASVVPRVLYKTDDNGTLPFYHSHLNTHAAVIQSPEVLERVIARQDVRQTAWSRGCTAAGVVDSVAWVDRLARKLSVSPRRGTELIEVTATSKVPTDAAVIANAVAEEYERFWRTQELGATRRRLATLRTQLADVQAEVDRLFDEKFKIAERLGSNGQADARSQLVTRLNRMRAEQAKLKGDLVVRKFEMEMAAKSPAGTARSDVDGRADSKGAHPAGALDQNDVMWMQARVSVGEARRRLEAARMSFGEAHPLYRQAQAEVKDAEEALRFTEDRFRPARLAYLYQIQERREEAIEEPIRALESQLASTEALAQDLARTEELYQEKKAVRRELLDRLRALETESTGPGRVTIQSAGLVRRRPSSDRRILYGLCALAAALMAGIGVGYLRSRTDPTIHGLGDLSSGIAREVPFLGQLPRARDVLAATEDSAEGLAINEHMRIIRTMLLRRFRDGGGSVVITSPEADTGKTTVSVLLARSLARIGKKVLLVDADLSRPSLSQHFGLEDGLGLRGVVTECSADSAAIVATDVAGLDVLPAGRRTAGESQDLLANGAFATCLDRWKQVYDYVLLDSPPVLSIADARISASHADGAVMVLRASCSRREDALEAFSGLTASGATLLGTVLVGVEGGSAGYPYAYHLRHSEAANLLA